METERDSSKKVRDSQKWKKVTILQPRSYVKVATQLQRLTYQEDPDVSAGATQAGDHNGAARADQQAEGVGGHAREEARQGQLRGEGGAEVGQQADGEGRQDGADACQDQGLYQDRQDIRVRLRRHLDTILAETQANRTVRSRRQPSIY